MNKNKRLIKNLKYKFMIGSLLLSVVPTTLLVSCSSSSKNSNNQPVPVTINNGLDLNKPNSNNGNQQEVISNDGWKTKRLSNDFVTQKYNLYYDFYNSREIFPDGFLREQDSPHIEHYKQKMDKDQTLCLVIKSKIRNSVSSPELPGSLLKFIKKGDLFDVQPVEERFNGFQSDDISAEMNISNPWFSASSDTSEEFGKLFLENLDQTNIKYKLTKNDDNLNNVFYVIDFDVDFTNSFGNWAKQISAKDHDILSYINSVRENDFKKNCLAAIKSKAENYSEEINGYKMTFNSPSFESLMHDYFEIDDSKINSIWEKIDKGEDINAIERREWENSITKANIDYALKTLANTPPQTTYSLSKLLSVFKDNVTSEILNSLDKLVSEIEKNETNLTKVVFRDRNAVESSIKAKINDAFSKWEALEKVDGNNV